MITIANGQAFWGDRPDAPLTLVRQLPGLQFLTLDYLAEVTLSILALQRDRDSSHGYARDFVDLAAALSKEWPKGLKVICNAGGLNVEGCARACAAVLPRDKKIAMVAGDDLLALLRRGGSYPNMETGEPIASVADRLVAANAYLGADPIVSALEQGADLVITGRVADPSMVVAAARYSFGWEQSAYDKIAAATVAGHLLECGTQATGGFSTRWLEVPHPAEMGFPYVEMESDGSFIIGKPPGTGGAVTLETIKEQLLYEIGDPSRYLSPDATVSFLGLALSRAGRDRIAVSGAKGKAPPPTYKVSAAYSDGYRAEATLLLLGSDAKEKGRRTGEMLFDRVNAHASPPLEETLCELFGSDSECLLHLAAKDGRRSLIDRFAKEIPPLITSGPQGLTGYLAGRPKVRPLYAFWPTLISAGQLTPQVTLLQGEGR